MDEVGCRLRSSIIALFPSLKGVTPKARVVVTPGGVTPATASVATAKTRGWTDCGLKEDQRKETVYQVAYLVVQPMGYILFPIGPT
jgi:hypothetical protein